MEHEGCRIYFSFIHDNGKHTTKLLDTRGMKMDQKLLANSAAKLEKILLKYSSTSAEARNLLDTLSSLISDARAGKIIVPVDWLDIPGKYNLTEGSLGKYDNIETAYAEFKIEISGGESPALKRLRSNAATKP